ncbi:calmodulin, putative [Acanthamoeba castellanii str. Neff]|uniref:Calmodulin, putative n=1 Tax=Acanthamoeba castellanii (strain ATCC 30010 / Neff) TaxID=1257118 RepID=L8HAA1_ACACF|nr:calmodulin, putative [Acanthamoeba castellanii str. Neff]ELR22469.1 calmodulin, putative [Acanthamoeba castellanii str. Neff]
MANRELEHEIKEAWKALDKDKDGVISASDLRHVLTTVGEKLTEEEIVALLQEADADKNGKIKFDHFLQVMLAK